MSNPRRLDSGPKGPSDYLHRCLELFAKVTEIRYGKRQRLEEAERKVIGLLAGGAELSEIVHAIYNNPYFDAGVFGPLHGERIEDDLQRTADGRWRSLPDEELIKILYRSFSQIEPVSIVMRFIFPERFGIISYPVAALLGVRPSPRATATYEAYFKSLREIGGSHGIKRAADVDMALWALQIGVLDELLPAAQREPLKNEYNRDRRLRQLATRNLTKRLFAQTSKLDVAEALLDSDPALAGQIAGIEFEQLVSSRVLGRGGKGVERPVSLACCRGRDEGLGGLIGRFTPSDMRRELHHARQVRNRAVHCPPRCVAKEDVRSLINAARRIQNLMG